MTKVKEVFPATDEQPTVNVAVPTPDNDVFDHDRDNLFEGGGLDLDNLNKRWKECREELTEIPEDLQTGTRAVEKVLTKFTKKELATLWINEMGSEEEESPMQRVMRKVVEAAREHAKAEKAQA